MSENKKSVITLTGATGFLGSHLMNSLLRSGYSLIILGRAGRDESLANRILKLLTWFDATGFISQLQLFEIDFSKPLLGLPASSYDTVCSLTEEIIHCASDTCFSESQRKRVIQFNVQLLSGILDLASDAGASSFSYISTAYSAGLNSQVCREQLSNSEVYTNVYEESKALAEQAISNFCEQHSISLKIIRPTIVYGDSGNGRTLKFNAFYYPIRSLLSIREIYLNDIKNHGGKRSAKQGIYLDQDGFLFIPLRFYLPKQGGINLIPVDYFVQATRQIIDHSVSDGIYHLSNKISSNLDQLADFIMNFLQIKGIQVIYGNSGEMITQNPVEELFDRFIEPYRPYLSDDRIFERSNTDRIIGNIQVPEMTEKIFQTCMNYAIEAEWGEKIFLENKEP